jgi:hypothetical protein
MPVKPFSIIWRSVKLPDVQSEQEQFTTHDPGVPRQVVIPVDCVVPDMPVSMDEDSGQLNTMAQKYGSVTASGAIPGTGTTPYMHPSNAHTLAAQSASGVCRTNSSAVNNSHAQQAQVAPEPVVDLSVPMRAQYAQPDFMGAGLAPRQGQDIFDTW